MKIACQTLRRVLRPLAPVLLLGLAFASFAEAATVTIPGSPMTVYVNDTGRVTGRVAGDTTNVFFSPSDNDTPNAGFNLGFPAGFGLTPGPVNYGVAGSEFTPVTQGARTGMGTAADPYRVTTVYKVVDDGGSIPVDVAVVTQVVSYVNGASRFAVTYSVQNVSGLPLRFRAGEYADLYLADDSGTGFLNPGPPRLVGGVNAGSRHAGGIEEVFGSPWDRYQEGAYSTVNSNLADLTGPGLTNTIDPNDVDNGVAVQWDDYFSNGLAPGATATFRTAWAFRTLPAPPPPPVDNSLDAQLARLPAPQLGKTVNVGPVKGEVYFKPPARRASASIVKGRGFVALSAARQIPVGSLLDTRGGTVRLVSAARGGGTQRGDFNGSIFKAIQSRRGRGLTELRMARGKFSRCPSRRRRGSRSQAAARRSKRVIRRLRGNARGRFRTRGRYSAATVRGTDWTVTDRCDGTLTKVRRGSVVVRDFRRRKNVIVRAGRSRLVRAPR